MIDSPRREVIEQWTRVEDTDSWWPWHRYRGQILQRIRWTFDGLEPTETTEVVFPTYSGPEGQIMVVNAPRWLYGRRVKDLVDRLWREYSEQMMKPTVAYLGESNRGEDV